MTFLKKIPPHEYNKHGGVQPPISPALIIKNKKQGVQEWQLTSLCATLLRL